MCFSENFGVRYKGTATVSFRLQFNTSYLNPTYVKSQCNDNEKLKSRNNCKVALLN